MKISCKTLLALAVAQTVFAQASVAQDAQSEVESDSDVIVVTATKKANAENVQDVPLAVTAFNERSLEMLQVRDLASLSYSAPNISLDQVGTTRGVANFAVRGLGINSGIPSVEPTVGVFVDGVYMGINNGVSLDLFDIDSIELLRGPQGILFGRNTTGGAVLINSGNPTSTFKGKAKISFDGPIDSGRGNGNLTMQGGISGPLVTDILNFKLAGFHNKDRGYFRNSFNGSRHGLASTTILRGGLELKPTSGVSMNAKLEYFDSNGDGPAAQNHGIFARDSFDFSINQRGNYSAKSWFGTLRTDIDTAFGDGKITNIFGYRTYNGTTLADINSTPNTAFHSPTKLEQSQKSNELRYAGSFGAFDLTTGGYWFSQDVAYDEARFIGANSFYGGGKQDHSVYGLFAQADVNFGQAITLSAGVRWSQEDKDAAVTYVRPRAPCSVIAATCPTSGTNPSVAGESNGFTDKRSWSSLTPKVGLQYRLGGSSQLYAHWTRGFRSGGYNFRITAPAAFEAISLANGSFAFDEEKVDSFEGGLKLQSEDRKATLNTAAYLTKVGNMQREVNQSSATSGVAQSIFNTADATIWGLELEGRYALLSNLRATANLGYTNASYDKVRFNISGDAAGLIDAVDLALKLPRAPELTWGVGMMHDWALSGAASINSRINFQHRDRFAYTDNNFGWIPKVDQLDASIGWDSGSGISVTLYGKNLFDEKSFGGDTQIPFGGALSDGTNVPFEIRPAAGTFSPLNKGRVVGLEAAISF